ncbi:MmgE/PrpD family protein [Neorhizobium sp. T6_25]|uniref:MmgE/PrpD family protein n=1 Tax=Neorhizobium sp. T6_25 TaxID=2093833 RepID=UPI000CF86B30|nr:MmgE/PrpD family protein [Neorhizobium sp. T6_25]
MTDDPTETSEARCGDGTIARMASYVVEARQKPAPEAARQAAFRSILDLVGAAAAGLDETVSIAVRRMALTVMGSGEVPIWFSGATGSAIGAAWANSAAASALDLDDGHRLARGHPGAAVIPAAFAVAHQAGSSLEEMLSAIVIGYEVGVTIAAARTTYGNSGTWAAYAVVATAAALRRTPADAVAHALAIAGESAPNQLFASAPAPRISAPEGSDVKEGIPWSVVTGLVALGLAEAGHTGPRNILDSPRQYDFAEDLSLGRSLHICNTYFKLYACCRHVHAPLDALLALVDCHGIRSEEIEAIDVETTSGALRISNRVRPSNLIDVQYSIPYCLALAAVAGPQALLPLTREALSHRGVSAIASRVKLSLNPEFDARFPAETLARVTIACGERRLVSDVTAPLGEANNPLSWSQLEEKFNMATGRMATDAERTRILEAVNNVRTGDIRSLMLCLRDVKLPKCG